VSHIHPDHYDPPYLRALLQANEGCKVLIGDRNQSFLRATMTRDGFRPLTVDYLKVGTTELAIFPSTSYTEQNIDSALVVRGDGQVVVNMNDCPFDDQQIGEILEFSGQSPDMACLPYAGAGPTPQRYRFATPELQREAAAKKCEQFLQQFQRYLDELAPRWAMPFAGLYYLGGKLRNLNSVRGIPHAIEVKQRFGERVVILKEGGGSLDLSTNEICDERRDPYNIAERDAALSQFDDRPMPYENDVAPSEAELVSMLKTAHKNAMSRVNDRPDRKILTKCPDTRFMRLDNKEPGVVEVLEKPDGILAREEISLDSRLPYGLPTRKFHWNNAEIGSHSEIYRWPEIYDRRVCHLLTFLDN
jgi:UDP-MurNAc hydroxylase